MKGMTLFTGFDGAGIGMAAAGIKIIAGIEIDPNIAAVARENGSPVTVGDVTKIDPSQFLGIDALHASPPCPNFSVAKSDGVETEQDIALALAVCKFIYVLKPRIFTLENVWGYRLSRSWQKIENALHECGYLPDVKHMNAADYGVPQTRKRMIVRAVKGAMVPHLPEPQPWVGWYEAIEDLLPTLPESSFAEWQIKRLPADIKTYLIGNDLNGDGRDKLNLSTIEDPAFTITASNGPKLRAYLVNGGGRETQPIIRDGEEPAFTVVASENQRPTRAFLVHPTDQRTMPVADQNEPAFTIVSAHGNLNLPRAFIVSGQNSGQESRGGPRLDHEPSFTATASSSKGVPRAWINGGVVKMTPRALARLQTFPDWYDLPKQATLACKGIGNAVPPLLMQKIYSQLLR
ncbi:MAG TPA: DNA (cytosine-5-)-methyltransferase [Dissulfurispiraceae bacterium]|nr:DNA (cytosine-5-)-methyltransferase [Dissulfurispiraceae bacterium]